jgi:ribosome biogenesis GTPase
MADLPAWAKALGMSDEQAEAIGEGLFPYRLASVRRKEATGLGADGERSIGFPPEMGAGEVTVGDWVAVDPEMGRVAAILPRTSLLSRRAAGVEIKTQHLAANIDTLFITTSCNEDFNEARLERYLALALEADVAPVIVLTKPDLATETSAESYATRAKALSASLDAVLTVNAKAPDVAQAFAPWLGEGRTVAFVGSSGVGKSTLINALSEVEQATGGVREGDQKGRHTTTSRALLPLKAGGWVMDMPGMRELGLHDVAQGIDLVFTDLAELSESCRFRDCAHEAEPGCAVQAAIAAGEADEGRVARWKKLKAEDALNAMTMGKTRAEARRITRSLRKPPRR